MRTLQIYDVYNNGADYITLCNSNYCHFSPKVRIIEYPNKSKIRYLELFLLTPWSLSYGEYTMYWP